MKKLQDKVENYKQSKIVSMKVEKNGDTSRNYQDEGDLRSADAIHLKLESINQ